MGIKDANTCSGKANAEECPLSKVVNHLEEVTSTTDQKNRKRKKKREKRTRIRFAESPQQRHCEKKKTLAGVPTDPAPDPIFASEEAGARTDSSDPSEEGRWAPGAVFGP